MPDFFALARDGATFPWVSHAAWYYSQMVRWRQVEHSDDKLAAARATYRPDLYRNALGALVDGHALGRHEGGSLLRRPRVRSANVAAFFL